MFKVYFENCLFGTTRTLEDACSLGLAVHRSSNVFHRIEVRKEDESSVISFELKDKVI